MTRSFVLTKDAIAKIFEEVKNEKVFTWKCFSIRLQRNGQKNLFSEKVLKNSEQSVTEILALSIQVHI